MGDILQISPDELDEEEREALLALADTGDMMTSTEIRHACNTHDYSRKTLRVIDDLDDRGLVRTHQPNELDDDKHRFAPPKHVMLSRSGEEYVDDHKPSLKLGDMDRDELLEEVYELQEDIEEVTESMEALRNELDERLSDVERQKEVARVRSDVQQLDEQVASVEASLGSKASYDDLGRMKRDMEESLNDAKADLAGRINTVAARVDDVEAHADVLEEHVKSLLDWQSEVETRWEKTIEPWIEYLYDAYSE